VAPWVKVPLEQAATQDPLLLKKVSAQTVHAFILLQTWQLGPQPLLGVVEPVVEEPVVEADVVAARVVDAAYDTESPTARTISST
jgi:hypothetical protein